MLVNNPLSKEEEELSPKAIQDLRSTSRWVRILAVLGFVISLLSMISFFGTVPSVFDTTEHSISIIWPLLEFASMVVAIGLSFYLSYILFSYGLSTRKFTQTMDYEELGIAFRRQLIYWRWTGIYISILLGIYIFLFVAFLIMGIRQEL